VRLPRRARVVALTAADITSANECFELNLTRPSKDGAPEPVFSEPFHPTWTYAFFGDEQDIVGYKEPTLQLSFRANDMKPSLRAGFEEKVELPDDVYSDKHVKVDFETVFQDYLPSCTCFLAIASPPLLTPASCV
jgi:histone acetyltransferase 1